MSIPIPCPFCKRNPTVEHGPRGFRCLCPNRNRVPGRRRDEAVAEGTCPSDAPRHWRRSERAAITTWNTQLAEVHEQASRVSTKDGPRCGCGLLLPCENCPLDSHAIDRYVLARVGEPQAATC